MEGVSFLGLDPLGSKLDNWFLIFDLNSFRDKSIKAKNGSIAFLYLRGDHFPSEAFPLRVYLLFLKISNKYLI